MFFSDKPTQKGGFYPVGNLSKVWNFFNLPSMHTAENAILVNKETVKN
jgi:hypothetical protein